MKKIEMIKEAVDEICKEHDLKQPLTVPSAGKLIMQYKGVDYAIQLFQDAYDELKESPVHTDKIFMASAYKVTLDKILLPNKINP
jgi:hypothetical protein